MQSKIFLNIFLLLNNVLAPKKIESMKLFNKSKLNKSKVYNKTLSLSGP